MKMTATKYTNFNKTDLTKILLSIMFIIFVFLPLFNMFMNIDIDSINKVIHSANFKTVIMNSLFSTTLATIITIIIAYGLALCTERVNIKYKSIFSVIFLIPMLIPSISHGMGLIFLFGNNGILTNLFNLKSGIYGLKGIILGSVIYTFPIAYLMFVDIMKYQDASSYEAAEVLNIPKWNQFTQITVPYFRRPFISVFFAIFSMIITDYGVPLMIGGRYTTLSVVMYQEVIGRLNFGIGSVYGVILLVPAVIAFIADILNKDKGSINFVNKPFEPDNTKWKKILSYLFCVFISMVTLIPIFSFVILAFVKKYPFDMSLTLDNISKTLNIHTGEYLLNSIIIALLVATIGVIIAFLSAYMSARMVSKTSRFLHLSAITSNAIPGVVLGLSYVLTFKRSFIYGTIAILIMVNTIHFIASPYLMIYNSLSKLNKNLESVGLTLGINRIYMIRDIFIPTCRKTIFEMFSYFFVNSMMTISAVSFLATTINKPISLMITQFEAQMMLECAAVVSLAILFVNLLMKIVIHFLKRKFSR